MDEWLWKRQLGYKAGWKFLPQKTIDVETTWNNIIERILKDPVSNNVNLDIIDIKVVIITVIVYLRINPVKSHYHLTIAGFWHVCNPYVKYWKRQKWKLL